MFSPFVAKRVAPPTVASDKIIPLHYYDNFDFVRAFVLRFLLRFDDVLDPDKLRSSLETLLNRDGWSKLGARMRVDAKGDLLYHIPVKYDKERPAFQFSQVKHDVSIADHELASKLPKTATSKPAVVTDSLQFLPLLNEPNHPTKWEDYVYADIPQIGIHIISFNDATLVVLSWPHTLLDAMGRKALFDAWSLVLAGREDEVLPLQGVEKDPLATLGYSEDPAMKEVQYKLSDYLLSKWQVIIFAVYFLFEKFYHRKLENRVVCVPASKLSSLRKQATQELAEQNAPSTFLSDGDLLCAWWARYATLHIGKNSNRTVALTNVYGLRNILSKDLLPPPAVYIGNAVSSVTALLPCRKIHNEPISKTAQAVRNSIIELGSREQIEAVARIGHVYKEKGMIPLFGDSSMNFLLFSNWTKGKFFEVDFSPAVVVGGGNKTIFSSNKTVKTEEEDKKTNSQPKPGHPSYIQPHIYYSKFDLRNSFLIIGKDHNSNYWLSGYMRQGLWDVMAKEIESDG